MVKIKEAGDDSMVNTIHRLMNGREWEEKKVERLDSRLVDFHLELSGPCAIFSRYEGLPRFGTPEGIDKLWKFQWTLKILLETTPTFRKSKSLDLLIISLAFAKQRCQRVKLDEKANHLASSRTP